MGTDLLPHGGASANDRTLLLAVAVLLLQSHASPLLILAILYVAM